MSRDATRARIVAEAARLLREEGPAAVTTRAVAQAAGMQTPVLYRHFEDKDALLDAVAEQVFTEYAAEKARASDTGDPIEDLRAAWEAHIAFGLANPAIYALMSDPARGRRIAAVRSGAGILRARVHRVAEIGRLRVPEALAVDLIHSAGAGVLLTLLAQPEAERSTRLPGEMYDAIMRQMLTDAPVLASDDTGAAVVAFRTRMWDIRWLTGTEKALLGEWLDREEPVSTPEPGRPRP